MSRDGELAYGMCGATIIVIGNHRGQTEGHGSRTEQHHIGQKCTQNKPGVSASVTTFRFHHDSSYKSPFCLTHSIRYIQREGGGEKMANETSAGGKAFTATKNNQEVSVSL